MGILSKLPEMADDKLKILQLNAERLGKLGSPAQRASASALLPAIDAELSARQAAKRLATVKKAVVAKPRARARKKVADLEVASTD